MEEIKEELKIAEVKDYNQFEKKINIAKENGENALIVEPLFRIYPKKDVKFGKGWCIISWKIIRNLYSPEPIKADRVNQIVTAGEISFNPFPQENEEKKQFFLKSKLEYNEKFSREQYSVKLCEMFLDLNNTENQKKYLREILTENQVENLYETLENPFDSIFEKDVVSLMKVKGLGEKTIETLIGKYNSHLEKSILLVELAELELSDEQINTLLTGVDNFSELIMTMRRNPYSLAKKIPRLGFLKADMYAKKLGFDLTSVLRIGSYIQFFLSDNLENGNAWVYAYELNQAMEKDLDLDINFKEFTMDEKLTNGHIKDNNIAEAIYRLEKGNTIVIRNNVNPDMRRIVLSYYVDVEKEIAEKLANISFYKYEKTIVDADIRLKEMEELTGLSCNEKQKLAIKYALEEKILIITGKAGTGKSHTLKNLLAALNEEKICTNLPSNIAKENNGEKIDYSKAILVSFTGKAVARMATASGIEAKTINRLMCELKQKNKEKIEQDIVIIDEFTMTPIELFKEFLKYINPSSKLILLGDIHQLQSIGAGNLGYDLLNFSKIKHIVLTENMRQDGESKIIEFCDKILLGKPFLSSFQPGDDCDFFVSNSSENLKENILNTFKNMWDNNTIENKQDFLFLSPVKEKGELSCLSLNKAIQEIINPQSMIDEFVKKEIPITYKNEARNYTLRVGDIVINLVNNYETRNINLSTFKLAKEKGMSINWKEEKMNFVEKYIADNPKELEKQDSTIADANRGKLLMETAIYNGWLGELVYLDEINKEGIFKFNEGSGLYVFDFEDIKDKITLGYSISTHKSQGGEWKYLFFALDFSSYNLLMREILYTSASRAKKFLYCSVNEKAFNLALKQVDTKVRRSELLEHLEKEYCL
jgi:exodeoxyribonuclease V alpha subunit